MGLGLPAQNGPSIGSPRWEPRVQRSPHSFRAALAGRYSRIHQISNLMDYYLIRGWCKSARVLCRSWNRWRPERLTSPSEGCSPSLGALVTQLDQRAALHPAPNQSQPSKIALKYGFDCALRARPISHTASSHCRHDSEFGFWTQISISVL